MKKGRQIAIAGSDKNNGRFLFVILLFILSINLSGQKIQTILSETWTSGNWVKSTKGIFTYDVSGALLTSLSQTWDIPSTIWKDQTRSNYTNNTDGTAQVVINQSWNGSVWTNISRTTYTYNGFGKVLTAISEHWTAGNWQNYGKETNTYDGSGYLTNFLSQSWDMLSSAWKNYNQINYTNNSNGNPTGEITQVWNGVSAWDNFLRRTNTYDGSNKIIKTDNELWWPGIWLTSSRTTFTHDGLGYLTTDLFQTWDAGLVQWINFSQSKYTNNSNGTPSVVINQEWNLSGWVNIDRSTYTYNTPTNISESIKEADITVYPNPASDVITIKANTGISGMVYSITDQTGKMMLKGKLNDESTSVDITQLSKGIYLLNIGEQNQQTFKIIKQD
jgi:hypothetical protein